MNLGLMMKLLLLYLVSFLTSIASRIAPVLEPREDVALFNSILTLLIKDAFPAAGANSPPPWSPYPDSSDKVWRRARCRGEALIKAMSLEEDDTMAMLQWPYTQSPWDGDLKPELKKWGYLDDDNVHAQADSFCNFDDHHHMKRAFDALGIDTRSAEMGGPNHCFKLQHSDGPTVIPDKNGKMPLHSEQRYEADGKIYRVTNAFARIGINRKDGIVYFIHRKSPEYAAGPLWGLNDDQINKDDLPKLRSSSDLAFGLWNRVQGEQKIKMIMSCEIVNADTEDVIIPKALEAVGVDEIQRWPGTDIIVGADNDEEADAALALIGSPNGLGAGYFLLQHKKQLGGANFIYKIKILKGDDEWEESPYLIFYVDKHTPPMPDLDDTPGSPDHPGDRAEEGKVVKTSMDGKGLTRVHKVWAKL